MNGTCRMILQPFPFPPEQFENITFVGGESIPTPCYHWVGSRLGVGCTPKFDYYETLTRQPLKQIVIDHPTLGGYTEIKEFLPSTFGSVRLELFKIPSECS